MANSMWAIHERSVSSVSANIAEGYGRRKGKEYE
ncbi:MAG: hypothetical protein SCABRO_02920, partial [Candidatus Scalindua brodae]